MSNPDIDHWHALERGMRHLCGTISYKIQFPSNQLCSKDIVTQIRSLMYMNSTSLVVTCLPLEVAPCHGDHVSKSY
jgi:hypothetical protein